MRKPTQVAVLHAYPEQWPEGFAHDVTVVEIDGPSSDDIDQHAYLQKLCALHGGERIAGIWVKRTSHFANCDFLRAFPNAKTLFLASAHVRSLAGTEHAANLERLTIETGRTNCADLASIASAHSIVNLRIERARAADLKDICASRVQSLDLLGGDLGDEVNELIGSQVSNLSVTRTRLKHFGASPSFSARHLHIAYCKDFAGFASPLNTVEHLIVESCGNFDVASVAMLPNLRTWRLLGCRKPFDLDHIPHLQLVRELVITNCKVSYDRYRLDGMPSLRCLFLSPARVEVIRKISAENPQVMVANGNVAYLAGAARALPDYYSYRQSN